LQQKLKKELTRSLNASNDGPRWERSRRAIGRSVEEEGVKGGKGKQVFRGKNTSGAHENEAWNRKNRPPHGPITKEKGEENKKGK